MTPLGLYIHIPYCVQKCPYCDFNSYGTEHRTALPTHTQYIDAVLTEAQHYSAQPEWQTRAIATMFLGGGTPSLLGANDLERLLLGIKEIFPFAPDAEVTMEANPGTLQEELSLEKLERVQSAGVNRISFGAQSFSPTKLEFLGRIHHPDDTPRAVALARRAGITNINLDLIFGCLNETHEAWQHDLNSAIALSPTHISAYGLTIEPGTEFGRRAKKGAHLQVSEEHFRALYRQTTAALNAAKYSRYEVSNYSQPGHECQHNLGYWLGHDYLALGAGAHGFSSTRRWRYNNFPSPTKYVEQVISHGHARHQEENLTLSNEELEFLLTRLRLTQGLDLNEYRLRFKKDWLGVKDCIASELARQGLLIQSANSIHLTEQGFEVADSIVEAFAAEMQTQNVIL